MNKKTLVTLEYAKIKQAVREETTTAMGAQLVDQLTPHADLAWVKEQLAGTQDGMDVLRLKGGIPLPQLVTITPALKRLKVGATLDGKELASIARVLRAANEVRVFFKQLTTEQDAQLPVISQLLEQLVTLPRIGKRLIRSVEFDGHVTDDASPELKRLRHQITSTEANIRTELNSYTHGANAKYLSDAVITLRDDRYVIPVRAENRGRFGGVVHDQSASGQTLFVEPERIVALNNRLRQQQLAAAEEVRRILAELSALLAPYTDELAANATVLGKLDFINAKARYAKQLRATQPAISPENNVYLRQAWHPLLDAKRAVKNDLAIGADYQAMVITGPNTGGKTITLKTFGLIQLMGQSGLFIPAAEGSRIGVFSDIFADIGDEQSIEQSLSTFSAHMTNIVAIMQQADDRALVLFDELGAGTDPQEGAALAIAILDAIGARGSFVVATTHYPELKAYGYERPGTINASMEFDSETLQPTYHLLVGIPGRSNAFDIVQRLGMDPTVVAAARNLTADDNQDLNDMIADLVAKRRRLENDQVALSKNLKAAEELHADLSKRFTQFTNEREQLMNQAKRSANELVADAKKKANAVISDLRRMRNEHHATVKEDKLIAAQGKLNALEQNPTLRKNRVLRRAKQQHAFHVNDDVLVKSYGQRGVLLRKAGSHQWEVQLGILKMKIDEADLEKVSAPRKEAAGKRAHTTVKTAHASHVSPTLDLRGERYDAAMTKVDRYLDAALLAGYQSVTIVHGKGTGALRTGITNYLKNNAAVKSFNFAAPNAGGNGATVVHFK